MYTTLATFYADREGGGYTADRVWTPGAAAPAVVWSGLVDYQDEARGVKKDKDGNLLFEFDGVIYPQERDEAEVLGLVDYEMAVALDGYGEGKVVEMRRLDGTIYVQYTR